MSDKLQNIGLVEVENLIFSLRGTHIMIDRDLAEIYQVETRVLNQAVKRNIERFPENFRFQLTENEVEELKLQVANSRSQIVTLNKAGTKQGQNLKYLPYAFTEQGVAMISAVLRSDTAIQVSIGIMDAFVNMRKYISSNAIVFQRMGRIEQKQLETDNKFEQVFKALEDKSLTPKQGIYFNGQIFDAWVFVSELVKSANKSLILIDNYVDESVLNLFLKRNDGVEVTIYTANLTKTLQTDLDKHNLQYSPIEIKVYKNAHDRFLIIDQKHVYHIGASLKDLGKKLFGFSKMEIDTEVLMKILTENK